MARVTKPNCSITGTGDYRKPYVCYSTLEYTVDGIVYKVRNTTCYHRELVEGDEVPIRYVRHDPTRIYIDM